MVNFIATMRLPLRCTPNRVFSRIICCRCRSCCWLSMIHWHWTVCGGCSRSPFTFWSHYNFTVERLSVALNRDVVFSVVYAVAKYKDRQISMLLPTNKNCRTKWLSMASLHLNKVNELMWTHFVTLQRCRLNEQTAARSIAADSIAWILKKISLSVGMVFITLPAPNSASLPHLLSFADKTAPNKRRTIISLLANWQIMQMCWSSCDASYLPLIALYVLLFAPYFVSQRSQCTSRRIACEYQINDKNAARWTFQRHGRNDGIFHLYGTVPAALVFSHSSFISIHIHFVDTSNMHIENEVHLWGAHRAHIWYIYGDSRCRFRDLMKWPATLQICIYFWCHRAMHEDRHLLFSWFGVLMASTSIIEFYYFITNCDVCRRCKWPQRS